MKKLEIADAEVMRVAIRQEIDRSEESRYDHRLHGVLLVASGQSCRQVAAIFGEDARTVQRWVKRFEGGGFGGLREGEREGRPRSLDSRQWRQLEAGSAPHAAGLWPGRDTVGWPDTERASAAALHGRAWDSTMPAAFRPDGVPAAKAPPQVAQSDPVRVAAVKKTPSPGTKN